MRLKEEYFATHPDEVGGDLFIQDAYFDWLLATQRFDQLFDYDGPLVAPQSLDFDRGMASLRKKRPFRAAHYFVDSFSVSLLQPGRLLKKDRNVRAVLSRTDRSLLNHAILFLMNHYRKYEALRALDTPDRAGLDAVVYYKMKALVAGGCPQEAKELFAEYTAAVADEPAAGGRGGLRQLALKSVTGAYRALAQRYAKRLR
jgi:hypothetical protein